jgi:hypothetical protein
MQLPHGIEKIYLAFQSKTLASVCWMVKRKRIDPDNFLKLKTIQNSKTYSRQLEDNHTTLKDEQKSMEKEIRNVCV